MVHARLPQAAANVVARIGTAQVRGLGRLLPRNRLAAGDSRQEGLRRPGGWREDDDVVFRSEVLGVADGVDGDVVIRDLPLVESDSPPAFVLSRLPGVKPGDSWKCKWTTPYVAW